MSDDRPWILELPDGVLTYACYGPSVEWGRRDAVRTIEQTLNGMGR